MAKHHGPVLVDTNVIIGFKDRLVALEGLLSDVGHKPKIALRLPYTRRWHADTLTQLAMREKQAGAGGWGGRACVSKLSASGARCSETWSEWQDLNLRPPRPERGALPG
jgi:hypothetical protein